VSLPLSLLLAPCLYFAATLSNWPLILVSIGIVMGAFGQVTINDAIIGKYTTDKWRSRAYAVRYFIGFTAAGASVGLVAWLYAQGGFVTMLHAFGVLCLLVIVAALVLPAERQVPKPAVPEATPEKLVGAV
jgi:MFS family permease